VREADRENELMDPNLTPAARAAGLDLAHALIESAARRSVALFCKTDRYDWIWETPPTLVANLMLECLPRFVRQAGGQIAGSLRFGPHGEVLTPTCQTVPVDGRLRPILREGHLFVHFPDRRIVISSEESRFGDRLTLGVRADRQATTFWEQWQAYGRSHNYLRGRSFFADGEVIDRKQSYSWDNILLPAELIRTIRTHVEGFLKHRDRLRALGVKARRGLILSGPPGTGKTLVGKILADTLDVSFMWVTPRHIENAQSFADILTAARFVAPAVVFLEDLDLFAEEREAGCWVGMGELMNQLDGAAENDGLVTIATTNRLQVIEKALRNRPGRFDRVLEFGPLDEAARRRMVARLLEKADAATTEIEQLVAATKDYTGAQIEELVNTVYILAAERYTEDVAGDAPPRILVDPPLIAAAVDEFRVEMKARVGFRVA